MTDPPTKPSHTAPSQTNSPSAGFRMEIERRQTAAIVRLIGSVHMDAAEELRNRLLALVDEPNPQLVLDLSELGFICSLGLGALIAAHLRCRHHEGVVKLVAPRPAILDLLDITKLDRLFPPYPTVEAAIAAH